MKPGLSFRNSLALGLAVISLMAFADESTDEQLQRGLNYLQDGRMQEALAEFDAILSTDPGNPEVNLTLAELLIQSGDLAAARQQYLQTLQAYPDHLQTLIELASLDGRSGNSQAMVNELQAAIKAHPEALEPRLAMARVFMASDRTDLVPQLFADLDEDQQQSRAVLEIIAMAGLNSHNYDQAKQALNQLVENYPQQANYHYMLAMVAEGQDALPEIKQQLLKAYELDSEDLSVLLALAKMALAERSPQGFQNYLDQLTRIAPEEPEVLRLEAYKASVSGDLDQAINLASKAYYESSSRDAMLELAEYHTRANQVEMARSLVEGWLQENPGDVSIRMALANDYQLANRISDATVQYRAILQYDPQNVLALNNLAWAIRDDQPQQALEYIRLAASKAPDNPNIQDTLAMVEKINGNLELASLAIDKALHEEPSHPSMLFHKASIRAAMGEKDSAISILEQILGQQSGFDEQDEAQSLLNRLKN